MDGYTTYKNLHLFSDFRILHDHYYTMTSEQFWFKSKWHGNRKEYSNYGEK